MITSALVFLVLTATVGAYMAARHFRKLSIPWRLPIMHGLLATGGMALLITALVKQEVPAVVWVAFGLFVMAAIGGTLIFRSYIRKKALPSGIIIIHAMLALMGLLFLGVFLYASWAMQPPVEPRQQIQEEVTTPLN